MNGIKGKAMPNLLSSDVLDSIQLCASNLGVSNKNIYIFGSVLDDSVYPQDIDILMVHEDPNVVDFSRIIGRSFKAYEIRFSEKPTTYTNLLPIPKLPPIPDKVKLPLIRPKEPMEPKEMANSNGSLVVPLHFTFAKRKEYSQSRLYQETKVSFCEFVKSIG